MKLGEGLAKDMIDDYKKVLVGQYELNTDTDPLLEDEDIKELAAKSLAQNPNAIEYGTGDAEIFDYYITDANGLKSSAILKGSEFTIHYKVKFNNDIKAPIFTYKFKNIKGTEITGTNTMYEKAFLENVNKEEIKEVTFKQTMSLQGGDYFLSIGCTGFENDEFRAYHRLYDILHISVISDKNTVGYYDMFSKIEVK